ncbi:MULTISPECIES: hypothetical protein, partial [unclassified Microcoleus]|uniref:hypothetical protein n=1 Tax=unclassified Microcoleus TaxID=2642155 RepID=UPI0025F591B9
LTETVASQATKLLEFEEDACASPASHREIWDSINSLDASFVALTNDHAELAKKLQPLVQLLDGLSIQQQPPIPF